MQVKIALVVVQSTHPEFSNVGAMKASVLRNADGGARAQAHICHVPENVFADHLRDKLVDHVGSLAAVGRKVGADIETE